MAQLRYSTGQGDDPKKIGHVLAPQLLAARGFLFLDHIMDRKALGCCIQYHNRGAPSRSRPRHYTSISRRMQKICGCRCCGQKPDVLLAQLSRFTNSWRTRYKPGLFVSLSLSLCLTLQVLRLASLGVCFLTFLKNARLVFFFLFPLPRLLGPS
jgi:hypothetical protein